MSFQPAARRELLRNVSRALILSVGAASRVVTNQVRAREWFDVCSELSIHPFSVAASAALTAQEQNLARRVERQSFLLWSPCGSCIGKWAWQINLVAKCGIHPNPAAGSARGRLPSFL